MVKSFFKRIKSQKGMSGVLVALLLVLVGVGLIAGLATFMSDNADAIKGKAQTAVDKALATDAANP